MGDATKSEGAVTRTADIEPRVADYEIAESVWGGIEAVVALSERMGCVSFTGG